MKHSLKRVLALVLALALLLGILPAAGAEERAYQQIVLPNGDLERGDLLYWDHSGLRSNPLGRSRYDENNESYYWNLRPADPENRELLVSYEVELLPGSYYFSYEVSGMSSVMACGLSSSVWAGEALLTSSPEKVFTYGRQQWDSYQTDSFTLSETTLVRFEFGGVPVNQDYWGKLDNLRLYGTGGLAREPDLDWIELDDSDFEQGSGIWELTGFPGRVVRDENALENGTRTLELWASNEEAAEISLEYRVKLSSGYYRFDFQMDGAAQDSNLQYSVLGASGTLWEGGPIVTQGWDVWETHSTGTFVLNQSQTVVFSIHGTIPAGYWGHLDNLELLGTGVVWQDLPWIELPNSDFELGDDSFWSLAGYDASSIRPNTGSDVNDSEVLHLWMGDSEYDYMVSAVYSVILTPGKYQISYDLEGADMSSTLQAIVSADQGGCYYETDYLETYGWDEWTSYETPVFEIFETTRLRFELTGAVYSGYWGQFDNLRLYGTGEVYGGLPPLSLENGNFDYGDSNWSIRGFSAPGWNDGSTVNSSYCLPLWISDQEDRPASASYIAHLTPGAYSMSFDLEGAEGRSGLCAAVSFLGSQNPEAAEAPRSETETLLYESPELETAGFDIWETHTTQEFTLREAGYVKFELRGTVPAGYWGHFDNLKLWGDGDNYPDIYSHEPELAVPYVQGVEESDFVRGADVSSYPSLVRAGARFYDYEGNLLDDAGFFRLLSQAGFNYVRVRVWVDPFDAQGNGYGGGNNDLDTAKYLARLATDEGLRVLIDFHYSDFWADPGKQQAPKAWAGFSLEEKVAAVEEYTYNSLKTIKQWSSEGYMVDMVQIGNETTSGICGESDWANMAQIFSAGARAVRRLDEERMETTKVTVHFTNPERSDAIKGFADKLNQYGVDYDVFATSWYPYWHGTTENLTNVLKYVADTYGKKVLVAETSWAWTLEDGDGHDNTVRPGNNDSGNAYPFSLQGQADELTAAARAIRAVGNKGLGVFYWENAWIPVQYAYDETGVLDQSILASNRAAWESFGCGWASSYAGEYQADAAQWYGGSAVDNQSMFDFRGRAMDSLWTWKYMMNGTEALFGRQVEAVEEIALRLSLGQTLSLPDTLQVSYNIGEPRQEPVTWDPEALAGVDVNTPGVYTVPGLVSLSYGLGSLETQAAVTVEAPNLISNGSFEDPDLSMYSISGGHDRSTDTPHEGSWCLHFYNANGDSLDFSQTLELEPGSYSFSLYAQGLSNGGAERYIYAALPGDRTVTQDFELAGWAVWQQPELRFTLEEPASVTLGGRIEYGPGGWGTLDDLALRRVPEQSPAQRVFTDVTDESLYYYEAVYWAASPERGITAGTSETEFSPEMICTRAQAVTFLWRAMGSPQPETESLPFRDVPESAYYRGAAAWAWENGISAGTAPERFSPNGICTRAQFITMLWSCMGKPQSGLESCPFTDVKPEAYYSAAVLWALEQEVAAGTSETRFSPDGSCTRAQTVTFLWKAFSN